MNHSWTNWSGGITARPKAIANPKSENELRDLARQATEKSLCIRAVGTGHSFVPLCEASDGILVCLDDLQGVITTNQERLTATIWAGTKIHNLGEPLLAAGMAMQNMGDIDRQSLAGAISTGTHGTGLGIGNISTQVVGLRLITSSGDVFDCSAEVEPDVFKAAQVSLGALGLISQITLRLLPAYRLHERTWVEPFDECVAQMETYIRSNRHFEFFWNPQEDACAIKTLNPTGATELPRPSDPPKVEGRMARYIGVERIDWSHHIFPSERNIKFNEIEFAVPAASGPDCLHEVRHLMQTKYPDVVWPIEYRTLGADDIYLSPAYNRNSVTISVHQAAELPYNPFFTDVESIFRNFSGRPHWGKIHTHRADELSVLYPCWEKFLAIRQQMDPTGLLLNSYLNDLFLL